MQASDARDIRDASAVSAASTVGDKVHKELAGFRSLVEHIWQSVSWRDVRTGKWFTRVLTSYVGYHEAHRRVVRRVLSDADRDAAVRRLIEKTAAVAAISGAGTAVGVTAASVTTSQTSGIAAPFVWPAAVLAMTGEMLLRSLVHLHMACEVAELYGVRFPPGSEGELVRVYGLAVHAEMHETETDPGRGIVERVVRPTEGGGLGKLIAARLVGETLLRNAVPFADVVVSSVLNYRLTKDVGSFVHQYMQRRVQLDQTVQHLRDFGAESVELMLEGLWFIFIADGRLTGVETALLAHFLRRQGFESITSRFVTDEASWLDRIRNSSTDPKARATLLEGLTLAAASDGSISGSEAAIVRHAAEALGLAWEAPAA